MSHWKRVLLVLSCAGTLLVLTVVTVSATGAGGTLVRAAVGRATLMSSTVHEDVTPPASDVAFKARVNVDQTWTLDTGLLIDGKVTITCGPLVDNSSSATITLEQVAGSSVSHADGMVDRVACDGSATTYRVTELARDAPFTSGTAVAMVVVTVQGVDPATMQFGVVTTRTFTKIRVTG